MKIPSRRQDVLAGLSFLLTAAMPPGWRKAVHRKLAADVRKTVLREEKLRKAQAWLDNPT